MAINVKFNYLYRDAGNFKIFGFVIFSNPNGILLDQIESRIKLCLIEGEFFDNEKIGLPALSFDDFNRDLDHGLHEYEGIEITNQNQNEIRSIDEFLEIFSAC